MRLKIAEEGNYMKRMILLGVFVLFVPGILQGQDKVEAPVWNVGDRWSFTAYPTTVVIKADESTYTVKLLKSTHEEIYIYDKSCLNILYSMEGDRRIPFKGADKRILNFPFTGSWKDTYSASVYRANIRFPQEYSYIQSYAVLGWEDVEVRAGKFKALKIEVKHERLQEIPGSPKEGKLWVWYSPDVKYLIKGDRTTAFWPGYPDWELTSFKLKK
jgi:hypothetical protein